jgi:aspartate ammonia-lyase
MPGKVNPVIPEAVNQVAFAVMGADTTVTAAAEAGQLQLNAFEPIIASSILQSVVWLTNACRTLRINCVDGITANVDRLHDQVEASVGVVTALTPFIGYAQAATIAHEALAGLGTVRELVIAQGLMDPEELDRVLSPSRLSGLTLPTRAIVLPPVPEGEETPG